MQDHRNGRVLQFGAFELKTGTGELWKHGTRIRLQGKPFQLLQALLERPGDVVTREELRERLWAADTFVDFESGLNTTVNRLRLALGDTADHPRYVETLARNGYRFVAPVAETHPSETDAEVMPAALPAPAPPPALGTSQGKSRSSRAWVAAAIVAGLLAATTLLLLVVRRPPAVRPTYHQLTFRRTAIESARFGPDGQSVIYEAYEMPDDGDLYLVNPVSPESRPLGFPHANLAAVSRSGELALLTPDGIKGLRKLVRVPMNGGAPLPIDRDIWAADWAPDGSRMAVVRSTLRPETLEYPRGKIVYRSSGWFSDVRISPSGNEVAFIDHPILGDDGGNIMAVDSQGARRVLAAGWASAEGLAWNPTGREVWFTAARTGLTRALYAVGLSGKLRLIAGFPGTLTIFDISPAGRVLIARVQSHAMMSERIEGDPKERNLSWFDYTNVMDISADGSVILFEETGEGGGEHHSVYIRRSGARSAVRVGDGFALALSPDANWVVTLPDADPTSLNLIPLNPGQPRVLSGHGLKYACARFFPNGDRLLVGGSLPGAPERLYIQSLDGSKPVPLSADAFVSYPAISQDGKWIAGVDNEQRLLVLPVEGGAPKVIATGLATRAVLRWNQAGNSLLIQSDSVPAKLLRVDVETGRSKPWTEIAAFDLPGIGLIWPAALSHDERTLVYSFQQKLSELFVVDGWR
jgi:DNA-binding winged helix-turn-helix (wHTH) protein/Tol biopolymer transport system component